MGIQTKVDKAVKKRAALLGVAMALCWLGAATGYAADALVPVELGRVQVGGEIGRRVDVTIANNLLALDADKDFLPPFAEKRRESGYIGLGKLIDAAVRFAVYRKDDKVLALKKHLVDQVIGSQEPDGYIGMLAPTKRMSGTLRQSSCPASPGAPRSPGERRSRGRRRGRRRTPGMAGRRR